MENKQATHWGTFRDSFRVDRRFWLMLLWEALLIVAMVVGIGIFADRMNSLEPMIASAEQATPFEKFIQPQPSADLIGDLQSRVMTYFVLLTIFVLAVWPFFKSLGYMTLLRKRLEWSTYWRFIIAEVIWTAMLVTAILALNMLFYSTLFTSLPTSAAARMTVLFGSVLLVVLFSYLTTMIFISLARQGMLWEGLKMFVNVPVLRFRSFIMPVLFTLAVFLLLNVIMRWTQSLPEGISALVAALLVLVYVVWLKLYYNACMDKVIAHHETKPKPAVHAKRIAKRKKR